MTDMAVKKFGITAGVVGGLVLLLGTAGAATAQGFGQPNSGQQPGFQQPGLQQPGFQQPGFQQPGFQQPSYQQPSYQQPQIGQNPGGQPGLDPSAAQFAPSMVGFWTTQADSPMGPVQQTDGFNAQGQYVSVGAWQQTGLIVRIWGVYRASPAGPNQLRVELQMQDYLPKQMCVPGQSMPPSCTTFPAPPPTASVLVTFTSPSSFQALTEGNPSAPLRTAVREPNPVLLQQQVPPQQVLNLPQPSPVIAPSVGRGPPIVSPVAPSYRSTCDDGHTRTICSIRGGRLVSSGGCLACVD